MKPEICIKYMTDYQRKLLKYLSEGMPISEIARTLGKTPANVLNGLAHLEKYKVVSFKWHKKGRKECRDYSTFKIIGDPVGSGYSYSRLSANGKPTGTAKTRRGGIKYKLTK